MEHHLDPAAMKRQERTGTIVHRVHTMNLAIGPSIEDRIEVSMRMVTAIALVILGASDVLAGEALNKDIAIVVKQGRGTPDGRAAWDRLAQAKADALPAILEAMNTKDVVASNWLRTAFDHIVEREMKTGVKDIDLAKILAFVKNPAKEGRARRFALEFVERLKPGTRDQLYHEWLDDPEFRFEAVALELAKAKKSAKAGDSLSAVNLYRRVFDKSRDIMQA